jgi:hypothetical protein
MNKANLFIISSFGYFEIKKKRAKNLLKKIFAFSFWRVINVRLDENTEDFSILTFLLFVYLRIQQD